MGQSVSEYVGALCCMGRTDYFEDSEFSNQRKTTQTVGKRVRYLGPAAEIDNCGKTVRILKN